jgi:AGZA family xanthine/uracil permease-like MFS transporter
VRGNFRWNQEVLAGVALFLGISPLLFMIAGLLEGAGVPSPLFAVILVSAFGTLCFSLVMDLPFVVIPGLNLVAFYLVLCGELRLPWRVALGTFFLGSLVAFLFASIPGWNRFFHKLSPNFRFALSGSLGLLLLFRGLLESRILVPQESGWFGFGDLAHPRVLAVFLGLFVVSAGYGIRLKGATCFGVLAALGFSLWRGLWSFGMRGNPPALSPSLLFALDIPRALQYGTVGLAGVVSVFVFFETFGSLGGYLMRLSTLGVQGSVTKFSRGLFLGTLMAVFGILFGVPGLFPAPESVIGIAERGRRGLAGVVCGVLLLLSLFAVPYCSGLPSFFAAPALFLGGIFALEPLSRVDFVDASEGIPAALLLGMTLGTLSFAGGMAFGILGLALLGLSLKRGRGIHPAVYLLSAVMLWWLLVR